MQDYSGGDAGTRNIECGHPHTLRSQQLIFRNIIFLNMEHSSHKSHVADVTTTGEDFIQLEERFLG